MFCHGEFDSTISKLHIEEEYITTEVGTYMEVAPKDFESKALEASGIKFTNPTIQTSYVGFREAQKLLSDKCP